MSEILTRKQYEDELLGSDGNQGWADALLAHDAALRSLLAASQPAPGHDRIRRREKNGCACTIEEREAKEKKEGDRGK